MGMYDIFEHTTLLLAHSFPGTKHTHTSKCLICRHHHGKGTQAPEQWVSIHDDVACTRFPSENELISTGVYSPKIFGLFDSASTFPALTVQIKLVLGNLNYSRAVPFNTEIHKTAALKSAMFVLDSTLFKQYTVDQTGGSNLFTNICSLHGITGWNSVQKLVLVGLDNPSGWYTFVTQAIQALNHKDNSIDSVMFLFFHKNIFAQDFFAWLKHVDGRASQRAIVGKLFLDSRYWTKEPNSYDQCYFV
jgi:hypothetical protein